MLKEQYQLELSTGVLSEMLSRSAKSLEDIYEDIRVRLRFESYLQADESGWRVAGKGHWLWSFSNEDLSFYDIAPTRGSQVIDEILVQIGDGAI